MTTEELKDKYEAAMEGYKQDYANEISKKKCPFKTTEQVSSFGVNAEFINLCDSVRIKIWQPFILTNFTNSEALFEEYCKQIDAGIKLISDYDI